MSWSCSVNGTKEAAVAYVEESLDNSAKMYDGYGTPEGSAEAEDCRNAKRAILAALAGMSLESDAYAPAGYKAAVTAYGSRATGTVTMHVEVVKIPANAT